MMQFQESRRISTTVIVPAFNEEDGLPVTLDKLRMVLDDSYEVIVVDDGSTDRTPEIARRFSCRFIRHEVNQGKGEALRTGIRHARGHNVIWIDADDTYPVETIPRMVEALDKYDVVVGSRTYGNENIPRFNRFGNWVFRTMIKVLYGFQAHDPCTGLYGARKVYLELMELSSKRFAIEPEISIKSSRMKLKTLDIPLRYRPRIGDTKLNAIQVGYEDLKTILSLVFWRGKVNDAAHAAGIAAK
jgi:glycosyltransferase involved in cell wall biosynthesis